MDFKRCFMPPPPGLCVIIKYRKDERTSSDAYRALGVLAFILLDVQRVDQELTAIRAGGVMGG